jgi:hypothetical protein
MKNNNENKKFGLSVRARRAFCATFLAGGLFGGQAIQAATPAPTIPDRVAAVREQLYKRVADLGSPEALSKLPYSQMQVASWLNWVNWPNWNNWRDWNNWRNWNNWPNWFNY